MGRGPGRNEPCWCGSGVKYKRCHGAPTQSRDQLRKPSTDLRSPSDTGASPGDEMPAFRCGLPGARPAPWRKVDPDGPAWGEVPVRHSVTNVPLFDNTDVIPDDSDWLTYLDSGDHPNTAPFSQACAYAAEVNAVSYTAASEAIFTLESTTLLSIACCRAWYASACEADGAENLYDSPLAKFDEFLALRRIEEQRAAIGWPGAPALSVMLHVGASSNALDLARAALDLGADPSVDGARFGITPLHRAAHYGATAVVALLLERGADPDPLDHDGATPLMQAAQAGHVDVMRRLIEAGADPLRTSATGAFLPALASASGRSDAVALAEQAVRSSSEQSRTVPSSFSEVGGLVAAAGRGDLEAASRLLQKGADVNATARNGFTSLHLAVRDGHLDLARLLLDAGADVNSRSFHGLTPIRLALLPQSLGQSSARPSAEILTLLLRRGASIRDVLYNPAMPDASRDNELFLLIGALLTDLPDDARDRAIAAVDRVAEAAGGADSPENLERAIDLAVQTGRELPVLMPVLNALVQDLGLRAADGISREPAPLPVSVSEANVMGLPTLGDWYFDGSGHYAYVLANGPEVVLAVLDDCLTNGGLECRHSGQCHYPADNGVHYDWFIRVARPDGAPASAGDVEQALNGLVGIDPDPSAITPTANETERLHEARSELRLERERARRERIDFQTERAELLARVTLLLNDLTRTRENLQQTQGRVESVPPDPELEDLREQMQLLAAELRHARDDFKTFEEVLEAEKTDLQGEIETLYTDLITARAERDQALARPQDESATLRTAPTASIGRAAREASLASTLGHLFPHLRVDPESVSFLGNEVAEPQHALRLLFRLETDPRNLRSKKVHTCNGWRERKFSTGQSDDGRMYYKRSDNQYRVVLSTKKEQARDFERLPTL